MTTRYEKLERALVKKGHTLTEAQIRTRFGLKSPRGAINQLRSRGVYIHTTNYNGKTRYFA